MRGIRNGSGYNIAAMPERLRKDVRRRRVLAQPFAYSAGLSHMTPLVRGRLRQGRPETQFQQPRNWRGHLHTPQIQAVGTLDLDCKLPLYVQKCGQNAGDGLSVHRYESLRRRHVVPDRRLRLSQDEPFPNRVLEWSGPRDSLGLRFVARGLHGLNFYLSDRGQMRQAFFNRPLIRRGPPIELGLRQTRGQLLRLARNSFKLLTIFC